MIDASGDPRPAVPVDVIAIDPGTGVVILIGGEMMDYEVADFLALRVTQDVAARCIQATVGRWKSGDLHDG
jgi:hypothetical protein